MIHYHGTPITPADAAAAVLKNRHALVSFAHPIQIELVAAVCHSFVLDNGAFSFWKVKKPVDWDDYYVFVDEWMRHPGCDWALIPDVIDGDEATNDALLGQWPFGAGVGVPVWHMHESLDRLRRLVTEWPRVALGSSGAFSTVGNDAWWGRMTDAMSVCCDRNGQPVAKLHGLRMLNPKVFSQIPLASADSTNIGRNINIDKNWARGNYPPPTKAARGYVMAERIDSVNSARVWEGA